MRSPRNALLLPGLLALLATSCPASPAPAAKPTPASPAPTAGTNLPDYGGRDAPLLPADAGSDAPNPLAQAGRAMEALVIVLAGVVGVLYLLKRAGVTGQGAMPGAAGLLKPLLQPHGKNTAATSPSPFGLAVVQSQPLPGAAGATLHLLTVGDKSLLLVGATAQGMTLLAEWEQDALKPSAEEARAEQDAFAQYLARNGHAPEPAVAAGDRLAVTADRLQDLLARSRAASPEDTQR